MRTVIGLVSGLSILAAAACGAGGPSTQGGDPVLPEFRVDKVAQVLGAPLSSDSSSVEEGEESGECLEWILVEESWNPETGAFLYHYRCEAGGDIAAVLTEGLDDGAGNGSYTTTYDMREGDDVIWSYSYTLEDDGVTQNYAGSSTEGETFAAVYVYDMSGRTEAHEVWTTVEGTYHVDGVYEVDGRFNGDVVFDDPATEVSPDWTLEHHEGLDGSLTQVVSSTWDGWQSDYTYVIAADGSSFYLFRYDELATPVAPDYEGSYFYNADGSGQGSYVQGFDDGSLLQVEDSFDAEGRVIETWTFDDAGTDVAVDQEGAMTYEADGSGSGTITFFFEDGESETCEVTVEVDGTSTVANCS